MAGLAGLGPPYWLLATGYCMPHKSHGAAFFSGGDSSVGLAFSSAGRSPSAGAGASTPPSGRTGSASRRASHPKANSPNITTNKYSSFTFRLLQQRTAQKPTMGHLTSVGCIGTGLQPPIVESSRERSIGKPIAVPLSE